MTGFVYKEAFCRNIGILSDEEQQKLKNARVAFAGLGGLGGAYALTMARSGLGHFVLADGDEFNVVNFNRQAGATMSTVGCNKASAIRDQILDINPEADVEVFPNLDEDNTDTFLDGCQLVINAIEAFAPDAYRYLFKRARVKKIPVITGAPLAFGAAIVMFGPNSSDMSADEYFDWHDEQSDFEKIANFLIGLAPKGLHLKDIDFNYLDIDNHIAPSNISAVMIGAGMVAVDAIQILLAWKGTQYAPYYVQFDARRNRIGSGRMFWGNRGFRQRFKRMLILRRYGNSRSGKDAGFEAQSEVC